MSSQEQDSRITVVNAAGSSGMCGFSYLSLTRQERRHIAQELISPSN